MDGYTEVHDLIRHHARWVIHREHRRVFTTLILGALSTDGFPGVCDRFRIHGNRVAVSRLVGNPKGVAQGAHHEVPRVALESTGHQGILRERHGQVSRRAIHGE